MNILVTGAAGAGTSTLAAALAQHLGAEAVEADALLWLPSDPPFQHKRDPQTRNALLAQRLRSGVPCVVAGSVVGWGVDALWDRVVFLYVDASVRLQRLQAREQARFGQADPVFLEWAAQYDQGLQPGRSLARHETWLRQLACPVVRLEGDRAVAAQLALIAQAVPGWLDPAVSARPVP